MTGPLLSVEGLRTQFHVDGETIHAVEGVDFEVDRGETVCLVGESGSGKTVTCESITRLIPTPPGEIVDGSVRFDGMELTDIGQSQLRNLRGDGIAYVFQNPQNALDPVYTVGDQLVEAIERNRVVEGGSPRSEAVSLLADVGIPNPASRLDEYPHQFSGGMRQRVLIAMALAGNPDLLIADEPTTAIDVTIEAGILQLLRDLQAERGTAILFVTHDLGVVAEIADRVVVMYGGKVMETGSVYEVFDDPAHPYTRALFRCLPGHGDLEPIGGDPVDGVDPPAGCRFHPRCEHAVDDCRSGEQPPLRKVSGSQRAACVYYGGDHDRTELDRDGDPSEGTTTGVGSESGSETDGASGPTGGNRR
jgi:peptide/nickel transport system ATP-binding protein